MPNKRSFFLSIQWRFIYYLNVPLTNFIEKRKGSTVQSCNVIIGQLNPSTLKRKKRRLFFLFHFFFFLFFLVSLFRSLFSLLTYLYDMPLLVHLLQYILLNMSQLIQWLLFLIGTLLILIPLYQVVLNNEKSLLKVSRACASRLGMHRFVTIQQEQPQQQQIEAIPFKKSSTLSLSLSSFTVEPASQVCLLRNNNTTHYISGLVNTGNSCFLNSVLQVMEYVFLDLFVLY